MTYAEKNVEVDVRFRAKADAGQGRLAKSWALQSEYLSRQMQAMSTQVQDLGQSAAKIVVDAAKPKT